MGSNWPPWWYKNVTWPKPTSDHQPPLIQKWSYASNRGYNCSFRCLGFHLYLYFHQPRWWEFWYLCICISTNQPRWWGFWYICICISTNPGGEDFDIFVFVFLPTQVVRLAGQRTHFSSPSSPSWSTQNRWSGGSRTSSWCLLLLFSFQNISILLGLYEDTLIRLQKFIFFSIFHSHFCLRRIKYFYYSLVSIKACWSVTSGTSSWSLFLTNNFGLSRWWVGWYHNDYVVPLTHF